MRILIFKGFYWKDDTTNDQVIRKLYSELRNRHNTLLYTHKKDEYFKESDIVIDENLEYLMKSQSNRLFSGVLDYCQEHSVDMLHIGLLINPEFLLAELDVRPKLSTKITYWVLGMNDIHRSNARANVFAACELTKEYNAPQPSITRILSNW